MNNLTATEIRALNEALDDEYRSLATYDQVLADFGEVRPFSNIREAEAGTSRLFARCLRATGCPCPRIPGRKG